MQKSKRRQQGKRCESVKMNHWKTEVRKTELNWEQLFFKDQVSKKGCIRTIDLAKYIHYFIKNNNVLAFHDFFISHSINLKWLHFLILFLESIYHTSISENLIKNASFKVSLDVIEPMERFSQQKPSIYSTMQDLCINVMHNTLKIFPHHCT